MRQAMSVALGAALISTHFAAARAAFDSPLIVVSARASAAGSKGGSVLFLGPNYQVLGAVDVGGDLQSARLGPDARHVYAVHGPTANPTGENALAVIDVSTRHSLATVNAGYGDVGLRWSKDGARLYVFGGGSRERNAKLTVLDTASHRVLAAVDTPPLGVSMEVSPDGRWIFTLHGDLEGKKATPVLAAFDTQENRVAAQHRLAHAPRGMALSGDGRWLYVLDAGQPHKMPAQHKDGALFVVDAATAALEATLAVGADPAFLERDETGDRVVVTGGSGPAAKGAFLYVIKGPKIVDRIEVEGRPWIARRVDENTLCLASPRSVSLFDVAQKKDLRSLPQSIRPVDVLVTPDRSRAYVASEGGIRVSAFDLTGGGKDGSIDLASPPSGIHHVARTDLLRLGSDGRRLYVMNTYANRVNVIDTATFQKTQSLETGDGVYDIVPSPNPRHLFVLSVAELATVDTTRDAIVHRQPFKQSLVKSGLMSVRYGLRPVAFSRNRRLGFVPDDDGILVLDLRTGRTQRSASGLGAPRSVLIPPSFDALDATALKIEELVDRAVELAEEKKVDEAAAEYLKARAIAPSDRTIVNRLFALYREAGRQEQAYGELRRWVEEAPADPVRCWTLATAYIDAGRLQEAVPCLERAHGAEPLPDVPKGFIPYYLGRAALVAGDRERALRYASEAKQLGDPRAEALLREIQSKR